MSARLPWTLRRKGHQEIGFDLDGLLRLQVRRYPEPVSRRDAPGVLIFYGVIMGIGLGVGYLTPVKNLMLWFAKGLATGIAVAGFGLAKAIAGKHQRHPDRRCRVQRCRCCLSSTLV